ncbi:MAG: DUF4058 family protein [Fimbriiglobus sp.]
MPIHDWRRVEPGVFHGFHSRWITHLTTALNTGLLPAGYYADGEQVTRDSDPGERMVPDIVALRPPRLWFDSATPEPGTALLDAPPRADRRVSVPVSFPPKRHIVVRHVTGHRVVAMIEIVSPANKDRPARIADFAQKVAAALSAGVHVLVLDVFPPGRHDPHGIHEAITEQFHGNPYDMPAGAVATLASYAAGGEMEAFLDHPVVGAAIPDVPLFLAPGRYVTLPLEPGYQLAWSGTPGIWRDVLDAPAA